MRMRNSFLRRLWLWPRTNWQSTTGLAGPRNFRPFCFLTSLYGKSTSSASRTNMTGPMSRLEAPYQLFGLVGLCRSSVPCFALPPSTARRTIKTLLGMMTYLDPILYPETSGYGQNFTRTVKRQPNI